MLKYELAFAAPNKILDQSLHYYQMLLFNKLNEIFAESKFGIINKFAEPLKREFGNANDEYSSNAACHAFHLQLQVQACSEK